MTLGARRQPKISTLACGVGLESSLGHIGEKRALSPLRHSYSPVTSVIFDSISMARPLI